MSFLRTTTVFARRAALFSVRQPISTRAISSTSFRFAQGYGDGEGDPRGENPQDQGPSNSIKHNAEHPGPAPPAEGQGKGGGPTKGTSEDVSAQSGGSRSEEAKETGSSPTGGDVGKSGGKTQSANGATPKIHDRSDPGVNSKEKEAEVEQHNKEFEKRHDRAQEAAEDKVDKKFWKAGQGGADQEA